MKEINDTENNNNTEYTVQADSKLIMKRIMFFLQLFMCETLAKRILSIILIVFGLPNATIVETIGFSDKSVRSLRKALETGEIDSLFVVGGGGRKSKLKDMETSIVEEISNNNYHSKQQIVDMIQEKYNIQTSISAVSNLLKKTRLNA